MGKNLLQKNKILLNGVLKRLSIACMRWSIDEVFKMLSMLFLRKNLRLHFQNVI